MAAKADKDALKKNVFWIALGGFVVLWLIAVVCVMLSGDPTKKKAWEDAKQGIDKAGEKPKNEKFYEPWDKYGESASGHKDEVWKAGWLQQKDIYTWPANMKVRPTYPTDVFGSNPKDDLDRRSEFRDDYKTQFADQGLDTLISPAVYRGGFEAVVPKQVWHGEQAPTREEIWLAQEDFWVRREMLNIVIEAMNAVALFKDVTDEVLKDPKAPKTPEGVEGRRVFRNANWELDLLFIKDGTQLVISPDSTIKNINRTQKLQHLASVSHSNGVPFRFFQRGTERRQVIRIAGEPLAYEQSAKIGRRYSIDPVSVKEGLAKGSAAPLGVQQVLEWETSPIRQLDALEVGLHSHRTVTWGLKVNEELKKLDPDPVVEGVDPNAAPVGGPMGMMPMGGPGSSSTPGPGGPGLPGGLGGAPAVDSTRINLIRRPRYMHITKQCKHLPVALEVVVDQAHIHDVLGAVANSPLRIQITQVTFHGVPTPLRPVEGMADGMGPMGPMGPMGMPMGVIPGGPRSSATMPGGFGRGSRFTGGGVGFRAGESFSGEGGFGPMGGIAPKTDNVSLVQDNAKMVELTVYGIATLYERFPPAPPPADAPKQ
jgi:hypothetical protein